MDAYLVNTAVMGVRRLDAQERVYKDYISQTFNRTAETYDRVGPRLFSHFGNRLVEKAGLFEGASVLDVGCGRGAVLFPAAHIVGLSGEVLGIDIAVRMLGQAECELQALHLENAHLYAMDAEALGFPNAHFDFVTCGFLLYELYDLPRALGEYFRVLKPGGTLAVSLWGSKLDQRWDGFRRVVKSYRDGLKPVPEAKDLPRMREATEIQSIFSSAGFAQIQTVVEEKEFYFSDRDEWWAFEWSHGNRFLWERMDPATLERCRDELFGVIDAMKQARGIPISFQILLAKAIKIKE